MKIPKRELKRQKELQAILEKETLTNEEIDTIYEEWNPAMIDSLTENGVYFTPINLAFDTALFAPRRGHIVDACGGIGALSYAMLCRDYYENNIESITIIELNQAFVEIGKKLIRDERVTWVTGDVFDADLWESLTKELPEHRFDVMISNPPFGKMKQSGIELNYNGNRDLMVVELCLRYAKSGYFILPAMSTPFKFSGEQYYQDFQSKEFKRFLKTQKVPFFMACDGIDCDVYKDDWKNLKGIKVECVDVQIWPWSLDHVEDALKVKD